MTSRSEPARVLLRPEEAANSLGISRATAYRLIRAGELRTVRLGSRMKVPVAAVEEFAARLDAEAAAARG
jgi:excisionase family DNA binding protein